MRNSFSLSFSEYVIFIFVIGMTLQEFLEMLNHKPRISYFFKWWNIVTTVMLTLFLLAALFWVIGFAITGGWSIKKYSLTKFAKNKDGYQLLLLGNSLFSLAIVVSVFHLVDLCQVRSHRARNAQVTAAAIKPIPAGIRIACSSLMIASLLQVIDRLHARFQLLASSLSRFRLCMLCNFDKFEKHG